MVRSGDDHFKWRYRLSTFYGYQLDERGNTTRQAWFLQFWKIFKVDKDNKFVEMESINRGPRRIL